MLNKELRSGLDFFLKLMALFLFMFFLYEKSYRDNYFNYDSIPYVASAHMLSGNNYIDSHSYAWNLLEKKVDKLIFQDLCCGSEYRRSMFENPEAFQSHLPAYRTKSLYVLIVRVISDVAQIDEYQALKNLTIGSILVMTFLISTLFLQRNLAIYLAIFPILFLVQVIPVARLLTPDALIALTMFLALILLLKNKRDLAYVVLLLAILFRQTNIILLGLILILELKGKNYKKFTTVSALALAIYFINSQFFESIGYWKTYYAGLISMPSTFIDFNPPFNISIIFSTLLGKLKWMLGNAELNRVIALILITFLTSLYYFIKNRAADFNLVILPFLFACSALLTFVMIPFPDFRNYSGYLISSIFSLIYLATNSKN